MHFGHFIFPRGLGLSRDSCPGKSCPQTPEASFAFGLVVVRATEYLTDCLPAEGGCCGPAQNVF